MSTESVLHDHAPGRDLRRPRLGFLGVGWIGRHRLEAVARSGLASVEVVADPSDAAARAAAAAAPGARIVTDVDRLLDADLDGIVVATPSALHARQSIAAMERGRAVFCQKPLARSAAEARRVVDVARTTDRLLDLDLSYRHLAGAQALRQIIRHGELGDIYAAELTFHNAYGPNAAWSRDRALAGGGCVIDLGVHLVDLALWMLDFPAVRAVSSRLYAEGARLRPTDVAVEDYAVAHLDLACGAVVTIACAWHLPIGQGAHIRCAFHGTEGGALIQNVDGSFHDFTTERFRGTERDVIATPPDNWGERGILAWTARLGENDAFDPAALHFVQVADVLDRIYAP